MTEYSPNQILKQNIDLQNRDPNAERTLIDKAWQSSYNESVNEVKKQLQELKKATYELRRKISASQKGIKRALKSKKSRNEIMSKRSLLRKKSTLRQKKSLQIQQNCKTQESQTNSQMQNLVNLLVEKILISKDKEQKKEEPSYVNKMIQKLRNVHSYLLKWIVSDRIKRPKNAKRNQEVAKINQRIVPHAHRYHARRLNSKRSIRCY